MFLYEEATIPRSATLQASWKLCSRAPAVEQVRTNAPPLDHAGADAGAGAAQAAAEEVLVLSTVFRHLEFAKRASAAQPHPATQLLQTAYPTLGALLQLQVHNDVKVHRWHC